MLLLLFFIALQSFIAFMALQPMGTLSPFMPLNFLEFTSSIHIYIHLCACGSHIFADFDLLNHNGIQFPLKNFEISHSCTHLHNNTSLQKNLPTSLEQHFVGKQFCTKLKFFFSKKMFSRFNWWRIYILMFFAIIVNEHYK